MKKFILKIFYGLLRIINTIYAVNIFVWALVLPERCFYKDSRRVLIGGCDVSNRFESVVFNWDYSAYVAWVWCQIFKFIRWEKADVIIDGEKFKRPDKNDILI